MRQVFLAAGRVGAGHEFGGNRFPLRTTVPGVAAGHLPLRDGHNLLLGVLQGRHPRTAAAYGERSGPIQVILADQTLKGRPAWVDPIRMVMPRIIVEVGATVWA